MYRYKPSKYIVSQKIGDDAFLCSNFRSGKHIVLSKQIFEMFNGVSGDLESLMYSNPKAFHRLREGLFIVDSSTDEFSIIQNNMVETLRDKSLYHIIINPTLDCNLSCWYCYENKVPHSKMPEEVENGICKHIVEYYKSNPFKILKLSFFGGEPFFYPDIILRIILFAKEFCSNNLVQLILDFTTNGTLLSESILQAIKDYSCSFQITLDGNRARHNKIKFSKNIPDAFSTTINNIYLIQKIIPRSLTAVRINFDSSTLSCFNEILSELDNLDRLRTEIILKKVWQVDSDVIAKEKIFDAINLTLNKEFSLDYYSQGGICFADRDNQITFNYDGGVYKCTTIPHFNADNALGHFHIPSGLVYWKDEKISYQKNSKIPDGCKACKLFPSCGGPCRKKVETWEHKDCFLHGMGFSMEEYALIQFKIALTNRRISRKYAKN